MNDIFDNKSSLITGGTCSFGNAILTRSIFSKIRLAQINKVPPDKKN